MKQIPLTRNQVALVDDSDFEELNRFKWCALKARHTFYAARTCSRLVDGKRHTIRMHRQILNAPHGMDTDHRDHDGLNNQRYNLRICTNAQNQRNRRLQKGTSKYKGVHWDKQAKKWYAQIKYNGRVINLGRYDNEIEAAVAYDTRAKELFGEFACLNFERKKAS